MPVILNLSVALEMLAVNLTVTDVCAHRKYSLARTLGVLIGYTVFVVGGAYLLLSRGSNFGNGNGLFALVGFLYLIPLKLLYRDSLRRLVSILFTSWVYTMLVFCLSVHAAYMLPNEGFVLWALVIQTGFYAATLYFFISWIKHKFLFILQNISAKVQPMLQYISLSWFATAILVNLVFIYPDAAVVKVLSLCALGVNAALSYALIHQLTGSTLNVRDLKQIAYVDSLTGLSNRARLFLDAEEMIAEGRSFSLIFIDLNRFKSINDQYGHLAGDRYLCAFVRQTEGMLGGEGVLYRMSGDEFVCLYTGAGRQGFLQKLRESSLRLPGWEHAYLGCSVGYVSYPETSTSLDTLLLLADREMYVHKRGETQ